MGNWWHHAPFFVVGCLLLAEIVLSVRHHGVLCSTVLADTVLILVSLYKHSSASDSNSRPLFQRMCACVAFVAILFVSTTHALEAFSSHSHDSDHIPVEWAIVCVVDAVIKLALVTTSTAPSMGLSLPLQILLHNFTTSLVILQYFAIGNLLPMWDGLRDNLDSILSLIVVALSVGLIIPAFMELKPYIFVDSPSFFRSENFQAEITKTFSDVRCSHIHVYRLWPGQRFEALIHLDFLVKKDRLKWMEESRIRYEQVFRHVRSALFKGGAQRVVVEPRFVDSNIEGTPWMGCVDKTCSSEEKSCCKPMVTMNA